jgi:hypothetical protein
VLEDMDPIPPRSESFKLLIITMSPACSGRNACQTA